MAELGTALVGEHPRSPPQQCPSYYQTPKCLRQINLPIPPYRESPSQSSVANLKRNDITLFCQSPGTFSISESSSLLLESRLRFFSNRISSSIAMAEILSA